MAANSERSELQSIPHGPATSQTSTGDGHPTTDAVDSNLEDFIGQSLPLIDGGKAAWRLLCAAFVFESLLWGFPLSFGVFQNYYSQLPEFKDSPYISVIGTVASGMSYMAAPVMIYVTKRYSKYRKLMIWIGCGQPALMVMTSH